MILVKDKKIVDDWRIVFDGRNGGIIFGRILFSVFDFVGGSGNFVSVRCRWFIAVRSGRIIEMVGNGKGIGEDRNSRFGWAVSGDWSSSFIRIGGGCSGRISKGSSTTTFAGSK